MNETTKPIAYHQWATTGVSGYPLTHPIVGQDRFYETFRHFIHLVQHESEKFAHVFAVIAQWGVGKSRLAYEMISQINNTSPGWFVRDSLTSEMVEAKLFDDDADRDQYLGLYIRYSQIATEYNNIDNWFAYGMYKALLPLAKGIFDNSIQGQIAKESHDRLTVLGFEQELLAKAMQLSENYSDQKLYDDPFLLTDLCTAAYTYLKKFDIKYILIALDELETVAESATYGLESEDIKRLDGRAIKLIGKAIKEEDPRRKLPWLRYVALCSPAIGDELREIQSTARRFELVQLSQNVFSDVSDFVKRLADAGRLSESYPEGLVEAVYVMSGGNFGWFNVIMANIDEVLRARRIRKENSSTTIENLFDEIIRVSSRMRDHVLDSNAINGLKIENRSYLEIAKKLLYGQLPLPLSTWQIQQREALRSARNEYDEPIALLYRKVEWEEQKCSEALSAAKFNREKDDWFLGGIEQPLNLKQLLANLATYAIHETKGAYNQDGKLTFLVPIWQKEFIQLVSLLAPHPAASDAARALWRAFIGLDDLEEKAATHIGPSIDMLVRLNIRYRKQSQNSLIFRNADHNTAYENAIVQYKSETLDERAQKVLTGAMRILDVWSYDPVSLRLKSGVVAITTTSSKTPPGLVSCKQLKLHPKGRLILAWVRNKEQLGLLCDEVSREFVQQGRTPVIALTSSRSIVDFYTNPASDILKNAKNYLTLYYLSSNEEDLLRLIGLPTASCTGFELSGQGFTHLFNNRINTLKISLLDSVNLWRQQLNSQGRVAWPMRITGNLKPEDRDKLFRAWCYLMIECNPPASLTKLDEANINAQEIALIIKKLEIPPEARNAGYAETERAMLFKSFDSTTEPDFPPFLEHILDEMLRRTSFTLRYAEREWFWGYTWEGTRPKDAYIDWMALACDVGFACRDENSFADRGKSDDIYKFRERGELQNLIQEARNWLQNDYPKIVLSMESVFGEGKVGEFFGPLGGAQVGSKTRNANGKLAEAQKLLDDLEIAESSEYERAKDEERKRILIECARRRLAILDKVKQVYFKTEYDQLKEDKNSKTLSFEDDSEPLWKRIRRAELFSSKVHKIAEIIKERINTLKEEMRSEVSTLKGFPLQIFTLSLEKIKGILDGALSVGSPDSSTKKKQYTESGTLGQYLRDLKIADATNKLAQLAREVGVDIESQKGVSLNDINGDIINGFRNLKKSFEHIQNQLNDLQTRINTLENNLKNAPQDFKYPTDTLPFDKLLNRPSFIEDSLSELNEQDSVDRLRSNNDSYAKLGNFKPLMQASQDLMTEPKRSLQLLAGQIATVENSVVAYRKGLLDSKDIKSIERSFNLLLQAQGKPPRNELNMSELINAGSLKAAVDKLKDRRIEWVNSGNEILAKTGISFERWQQIVADIDEGKDPELSQTESDKLVSQKFLRRIYAYGGKQ